MTRYKRPNKRNKTRKIKKMKGGEEPNIENQIKEFAIKTIEDKMKGIYPAGTTVEDTGVKPAGTTVEDTGVKPAGTTVEDTGVKPAGTTVEDTTVKPAGESTKTDAIEIIEDETKSKPTNKKNVFLDMNFYERRLKDDKFNKTNPFHHNISINRTDENVETSIAGVEELLKIFENEIKYMKEPNDNNKLLPDRRKSITINYKERGIESSPKSEEKKT